MLRFLPKFMLSQPNFMSVTDSETYPQDLHVLVDLSLQEADFLVALRVPGKYICRERSDQDGFACK